MYKKKDICVEWKSFLLKMILLILSALTTIKVIFLGGDIDEEYAIAMAYRMAIGDRMFMEMWEPHQTSGFFIALLVKIFMRATGGTTGVVLFVRMIGTICLGVISILIYRTMKGYSSNLISFVAAIFYYNTMIKYSPVPDFANMLVWFSTLMYLCLLMYARGKTNASIWLSLAGVCTSLLVLSYPPTILSVIPVCIGILKVGRKEKVVKDIMLYMGMCGFCGILYIMYFLSHMSMEEFCYGLSQMMTDGSHSLTYMDRIQGYGRDIFLQIPHFMLAAGLALFVWIICKFVTKKKCSLLLCMIATISMEQMYVWIFDNEAIQFPGLLYPLLLVFGIICYAVGKENGEEQNNAVRTANYWFGSMVSLGLFFAATLVTNEHLWQSNEYMMIGMLVTFSYFKYDNQDTKFWCLLAIILILGTSFFRKGYLMYFTYGKDTICVTKQKALDGPLKGVYARWSVGVTYNEKQNVLDIYVPHGSRVLYIGAKNLLYLQGQYDICNFSTISTPTIDERIFEYWALYPDKYPEYIIWDNDIGSPIIYSEEINEKLIKMGELVFEDGNLRIYRVIN